MNTLSRVLQEEFAHEKKPRHSAAVFHCHGTDYCTGRISDACGPLAPCFTTNSTFWPSDNDLKPPAWISEKCAKRSLPPSSGVMKPKPFASLNHLTVPAAIFTFLDRLKVKTNRP